MIGSLRKIWPFKIDLTPDIDELKLKQFENIWPAEWTGEVLFAYGLAVVAFIAVLILDRITHGHEHPTHEERGERSMR